MNATTESMRGLLVSVLRPADMSDCTNGGVTGRHTSVILCGPGIPEVFEADAEAPAMMLVPGYLPNTVRAVPAAPLPDNSVGRWMAGGNFLWSSDSRFPSPYPITVHDRTETWEQYESLSK